MATVLMSLWDIVGYNHIVSSDAIWDKLTVWMWGLGLNTNCNLRFFNWGDGTVGVEIRTIEPNTGLGGTVCWLVPRMKKQKGLGRWKAEMKKFFQSFPLQINGTEWSTWQEYIDHEYTEWMKDPH